MTVGVTSQGRDGSGCPIPTRPTRYSTRDLAAEQAAVGELLRAPVFRAGRAGPLPIAGQNQVLNFFARIYPRLQKEWEVTLEERLERSTQQNIERIEPRFQITPSGVQWFDLDVVFAARSGERFSAADIQRLILSGQSHTRLKNGQIAVIDTGAVEELQEVLLDCAPQQHAGKLSAQEQPGRLPRIHPAPSNSAGKCRRPAQWRERAAQPNAAKPSWKCPPLGDLETVLRPYQKQGVAWLRFLRENGFGGILADEMGLGKTLQTWLSCDRLRNQLAGSETAAVKRPFPGRLPDQPGLQLGGRSAQVHARPRTCWRCTARNGASSLTAFATADLVITSYALIRRDAELYTTLEFDTVVLDEAQHIKNRQTQNAQAVKAVRAGHRLVLTGTPLENSVLDLWSIFDFLMPGYLGTATGFSRALRTADHAGEERRSPGATRRGGCALSCLRRLKREVAKDLPERIEQVSFCELTEDQRAVYQQILEASRKEVLQSRRRAGRGRRAAWSCSPRCCACARSAAICACSSWKGVDPSTASGKLDLFGELLEEVIDGGHRVLVFSQFVQMLTLLREKLSAEQHRILLPRRFNHQPRRGRGTVPEQARHPRLSHQPQSRRRRA